MKTIEECLDEAVKRKSEFSSDFKELMLKYKTGDCVRVFIESVIEEAMNIHAQQCCNEQKAESIDNIKKSISNITWLNKAVKAVKTTPNVAENP